MPDRITSAGDGVNMVAETHESRIFQKPRTSIVPS